MLWPLFSKRLGDLFRVDLEFVSVGMGVVGGTDEMEVWTEGGVETCCADYNIDFMEFSIAR
jgi:hypothetical protein